MDIFKPSSLRTEIGFRAALQFLEDQISVRSPRLDRLVENALQQPGLLELFVSKMAQQPLLSFWTYLKDQCSDDSTTDFLHSIPFQVLCYLETSLLHIPIPFDDLGNQVQDHYALFTTRSAALKALEPYCEIGPMETISSLSSRPFVDCKVKVPRTGPEAKKLAGRLIRDLAVVLKGYFDILHDGRLAEAIRKHHLSVSISDSDELPAEPAVDGVPGTSSFSQPHISRKKAAMTLDTIDRFGPVKITVSTRFIDNMRTSRKRPRLFAKIKTTVTELAQGETAGQNGMVLATSDEGTPVYSAFLNKHCSLVYYYHPVGDADDTEIRIFGVYAADALENQKFWDGAVKQLAIMQHSDADNLPSTKSPMIEPEIADQIRFLVVLDRFVELSKPIMQRIQDDKEIQAMFQLSPQEEEVIEHDGSCYVLGRSGTGKTTIMLFKMINMESAWYQYGGDVALKPRQLFVTRSQHLADRVRESFARLYETHVVGSQPSDSDENSSWTGTNQTTIAWNSDVPDGFDELKAEHFPLFISYDKLCTMLEIALGLVTYSNSSRKGFAASSRTLLTYEIFLTQYWDVCPSALRLDFDPFLVYGEIIGVIKGSEETSASGQRFLEKEAYLKGGRWHSTYEGRREQLYVLFQWYRKRQAQLLHADIADRTYAILESFREQKPVFLRSLDFVYVDETQDNLLLDAMVMRVLCKNSDGLLWAGDTAQTIFAGNSFTFNTLKAFMHRIEENEPVIYRARHKPAFFKLSTNFRSQGGIVACGQTILDVIASFWPSTLDQIPKEVNLSCGTRPYFFISKESRQINLKALLSGSNKQLEFGAEQCILVRNEDIRDSLRPHLGDSTLLLTLYESKGLEFNDVLLWNFFADSSYERSDWATLVKDRFGNHGVVEPPKGLSIELKFLYVATTRAKNRLWLIDDSAKAKVIHDIWAAKGEIETPTDGLDLSQFATASGQEEWARRGRDFFREARYKLAAQAWRMAGLLHDAAVANAFYLRDQVEVTSSTGLLRSKALKEAAEAFLLVARDEPIQARQDEYHVAGAECLLRVPDTAKAAFTYAQGREYTRAVQLFRSIAMFDEAIGIIRQHSVNPATAAKVTYVAKLYYFQQLRLSDAITLHSSPQEALTFLEQHGMRQVKGKAVIHLGLHIQAAQAQLRANRPIESVRHCRDAKASPPGLLRLDTDVLLSCLWREPAFSIMAKVNHVENGQASERISSLCELVDLWDEAQGADESSHVHDKVSMFKAISCGDGKLLEHYGDVFITGEVPNRAAALLCLTHSLRIQAVPDRDSSTTDICEWLHTNRKYVSVVRSILLDPGYCEHGDIQRLAGFRVVSSHRVRLLPDSLALSLVSQEKCELLARDGPHILKKSDLLPMIIDYFQGQLRRRVTTVKEACADGLAMSELRDSENPETYARLRCVLQQILIEDTLRGFGSVERHTERKRSWLESLYGLFIRDGLGLASTVAMAILDVPEGGACIQVLTGWIRDMLEYIPQIASEKRPTLFVQLAVLAPILDPRGAAHHMERMRAVGLNAPQRWLLVYPPFAPIREQTAQFVLNDLLDATEGVRPWSLHSGVQFLRHLIEKQSAIDVYTLCDFIDYLLGAFVVALCGPQCGLVLPTSGALLVLQNIQHLSGQETDSIVAFLDILGDVMRLVLKASKNESINSGGRSLKRDQRYEVFNRICQSIGILGYNVESYSLREQIVAVLARLRSRDIRIDHPPSLRFALAKSWNQVASVVVSSASVARLVPKTLENERTHYLLSIEDLLHSSKRQRSETDQGTTEDMSPLAKDTTPAAAEFASFCAVADHDLFHEPPIRKILCARLAEAMSNELPSSDEVRAFQRLQSYTRPRLLRQRQLPRHGLSYLVEGYFNVCLKRSTELPLSRVDRHLFLGPLPHTLACLDALRMYFEAEKDKLSRKLQKASHIDLEDAGDDVVRMHAHLAKTLELQQSLRPQSDLYLRPGWSAQFRSYVTQVSDLVNEARLEELEHQDLMTEWDLVYKAVLYSGRKTWIR